MDSLQPIGGNINIYVSSVHRYGTDAVLLADFARPKRMDKVCDLGTGCGIIPFLFSRENRNMDITAVDIQQDAIELVEKTKKLNSLENIKSVCADLKLLQGEQQYDLVTMNPPYKKADGGIQSEIDGIKIARHEIMCNTDDIISCAFRLLRYGGRLCMCQRPERTADLICAMRDGRIEPKRMRFVHLREDREPMLVLVEGMKMAKSAMKVLPPLIIEDEQGDYTKEVEEIYTLYRQAKGE